MAGTAPGRWLRRGPAVPLIAAALCLCLAPPSLRGGDLSVQLGLALARRAPEALKGDLLVLAAEWHPGFGGALQSVGWGSGGPSLLWLSLLHMGVIVAIFAALRRLWPGAGAGAALGIWLLAAPRPLGPALLLWEPQPTHRMLAAPLLLLGLAWAASGRGFWAGASLGLGAALHPSTGAQAAVIGLAVAGRRWPALLPGLLSAAAALVLRSPGAAWAALAAEDLALLRLRLGHHLDASTWPWPPRLLTLSHVVLAMIAAAGLGGGPRAAALRRGLRAAAAWLALGLLAPSLGLGLLLQLHPLYAEQWLVALSLPALGPRLWRAAPVPRVVGVALLVLVPWALAARPPPSPSPGVQPTAAAALRPWDDPWPRVEQGAPAAFTVKDGGEIIAGPEVARAWAAALAAACGPEALRPAEPGEHWLGYVRLRQRCRAAAARGVLSPR